MAHPAAAPPQRGAPGAPPGLRIGSRIVIPSSLIDAPTSDMAVRLYGWIAYRDQGERGCFEAMVSIARRLGVSRSTIHRARDELLGRWIYRLPTGALKARTRRPGDTYALVPVTAIGHPGDDAPGVSPIATARLLRAYAYAARAHALGDEVTDAGLAAVLRNKGTSDGNDRAAARPCHPDTAGRALAALVEAGWLTATHRPGQATLYQPQFAPTRLGPDPADDPAADVADEAGGPAGGVHSPPQPCDTSNPVRKGGLPQRCDAVSLQRRTPAPGNGATQKEVARRATSEPPNHLPVVRNGPVVEGERRDEFSDHDGGKPQAPPRSGPPPRVKAQLDEFRARRPGPRRRSRAAPRAPAEPGTLDSGKPGPAPPPDRSEPS
jgi:hypothetical protein